MPKIKLYYPDPGMTLHGENACKYHQFEKYNPKTDRDKPCMFWLYFDEDYKMLANHTGKKYVCWHGTDFLRLKSLNSKYINLIRNPEITHICLNSVLQAELFLIGIYALVRFIMWGRTDYSPQTNLTKDCFMCVPSRNPNEEPRGPAYGEYSINALAWKHPDWTFHIFGIEPTIPVFCDNVKYYGWVPEKEMDKITEHFGLVARLNVHDGFPQINCKALLREQFVITYLDYDGLTIVVKDVADLCREFKSVNTCIENGMTYKNDVRKLINNFDFIKISHIV